MSTYGTMQDRIATELKRSNLTARIQEAIQSAIKHYETNRFWFNEKTTTLVTTPSNEDMSLSSDFVELDSIKFVTSTYGHTLYPRTFQYIEEVNTSVGSYEGIPEDYAIYGDAIKLYPVPDATYTISVSYLYRLSSLSATADTNAWMTTGEELIRKRAKADIRLNLLEDERTRTELMMMSQLGKDFLTKEEEIAYNNLVSSSVRRASSGKIRPTQF